MIIPSRVVASLLLVCTLALPGAPARADEIIDQRTYVIGADTPNRTLFYISCNQAPYLGGTCFPAPPGARTVSFRIDDATTLRPGALVRFLAAGGTVLASHAMCNPEPFAVPAGTDRIQVFVNGPASRTDGCPGAGTAGTVTATFTTGTDGGGEGYVPSQPIYRVRADRYRYVPSGNSTIQVDVYRPDAPGRFPVIVWFDVYYKDDPGAIVNGERDYFVSRGFVFVHASSPGSNTSGGTYENAFGPAEQQAAYDVVEWAGIQSWSDGKVGMQGLSYAAIIEYFVAARRPPHLVTIYPTSAFSDMYRETVYVGGNLQAGYPVVWDVNNRSAAYAPPRSASDDAATQITNYATTVAGYRPIAADFVQHPYADEFYAVRSPATVNARTEVPAAVDVGWHDDMVYGGPINFEGLGSATKRLVIGPWGHSAAHRRPGGREERLRWFDHYLKGRPSGVDADPRARVFVAAGGDDAAGSWIDSNAWPIAGIRHTELHLGADGALLTEPQEDAGSIRYAYAPTRQSGETLLDEEAAFETAPLPDDVTVIGYPELVLYGSTDARDTSWNVTVSDVDPSGRARELQSGWLRARARELDVSTSQPGRPFHRFARDLPVEPNAVHEYRIAIWPFANRFPAGHRIRITIHDEPTGPGGAPAAMPPDPATNTVHVGAATPSRLVLPVL